MDRNKISLVVASILCMASLPSQAALNIYSNDVEQAEDARNVGNYEFSQNGLSAEEAATVPGFGKSMPLGLSLQIIVPNDWKVDLNDAAVKVPVDWVGKNSWPYVLEELAKDNNLNVSIDWNTRVVNVFDKVAEEKMIASNMKNKKAMEEKTAKAKATVEKAAEAKANETEIAKKKAEAAAAAKAEKEKVAAAAAKKKADAERYTASVNKVISDYTKENPGTKKTITQIYNDSNVLPVEKTVGAFVKMKAGQTLKEFDEAYYILKEETMLSDNLASWAKANGWAMVWDADSDFRVARRVEIKETMLNSIDKVVTLYKNSKKPLMVKFYVDNKVVKVEDFNYEK